MFSLLTCRGSIHRSIGNAVAAEKDLRCAMALLEAAAPSGKLGETRQVAHDKGENAQNTF